MRCTRNVLQKYLQRKGGKNEIKRNESEEEKIVILINSRLSPFKTRVGKEKAIQRERNRLP
jgi:hypothetical protein